MLHLNLYPTLGWSKNLISSETQKFVAVTTFSHYLGQKHYKKLKKLKIHAHLGLENQVQSFGHIW